MRHHLTTYAIAIVLLLSGVMSAEAQQGNRFGTGNIVKVAKSGPGFRSIQAALDSITDASEDNPYLVSVAPGVYEEQVTLKPHIDIQGAGRRLTRINSGEYSTLIAEGLGPNEVRSLTLECASPEGCISEPEDLTIKDLKIRATGSEALAIKRCTGDLIGEDVAIELAPSSAANGDCEGRGFSSGGPDDHCFWRPERCPNFLFDNVSISGSSTECAISGVSGGMPFGCYRESEFTIRNSTISVDSGQDAYGIAGDVDLSHSTVTSSHYALVPSDLWVRHSKIDGDLLGWFDYNLSISHSEVNGENFLHNYGEVYVACFSVHDRLQHPLDENCQPIP